MNITTANSVKLAEIQNLLPEFALKTLIQALYREKIPESLPISTLDSDVEQIRVLDGLKKLLHDCKNSYSTSPLIKKIADFSYLLLKINYIDDEESKNDLDRFYESIEKTVHISKRPRDEPSDEKGGTSNYESSE